MGRRSLGSATLGKPTPEQSLWGSPVHVGPGVWLRASAYPCSSALLVQWNLSGLEVFDSVHLLNSIKVYRTTWDLEVRDMGLNLRLDSLGLCFLICKRGTMKPDSRGDPMRLCVDKVKEQGLGDAYVWIVALPLTCRVIFFGLGTDPLGTSSSSLVKQRW